VAIVGTRHPTTEAAQFAARLAEQLAEKGIAVLSGGAKGIDSAAHRGALKGGGVTVVVAPAGIDRPYPDENQELFRQVVASGGAYLSLVERTEPAERHSFFPRNAVLVALAHVVVVVEARFRGGAVNSAGHARRLGRALFVVPHPPWHELGRGCLLELKRGARPLESVKDLLRELAAQNLHALSPAGAASRGPAPFQESLKFPDTSSPVARRAAVLAAVQRGASSSDEICAETGLSSPQVSELILTLRLESVLVTDLSGRLQIHK